MEKTEKLRLLWETLTRRYGEYPLKPSQKLGAVMESWLRVFGDFELADLQTAASIYMGQMKWDRWPTEGDLSEILKDIHARRAAPEKSEQPVEWRQSRNLGAQWFDGTAVQVGRRKAEDALRWWLDQQLTVKPRSWADYLAQAWNRSAPEKWEQIVADFNAHCAAGLEAYRGFVAKHGVGEANRIIERNHAAG